MKAPLVAFPVESLVEVLIDKAADLEQNDGIRVEPGWGLDVLLGDGSGNSTKHADMLKLIISAGREQVKKERRARCVHVGAYVLLDWCKRFRSVMFRFRKSSPCENNDDIGIVGFYFSNRTSSRADQLNIEFRSFVRSRVRVDFMCLLFEWHEHLANMDLSGIMKGSLSEAHAALEQVDAEFTGLF